MNGSDQERKLAKHLDGEGYMVIRSPASGSVDRAQPDLMWAKGGFTPIAVEMKTVSGDIAYFEGQEVDSLELFAAAFEAQARLCVRFKGDTTFYLLKPVDARVTPENNLAVDKDMDWWGTIDV